MGKGAKKVNKEADKKLKKVKKGTKVSKSAKRKEDSKPKDANVNVELGLIASTPPTKSPRRGFTVMVVDETQHE